MSFLLSLLSLVNILTVRIDWIHDFITIELKENIANYTYLPKATLYIDNQVIIDPRMFYERNGVEWTFITTVNTNVVRNYHIKYRVHYPSYNITQVKTITFNVVDLVSPEFVSLPKFRIPIGQKMPDLLEGLIYKDNYDQLPDIKVVVHTSDVILSRVGIYDIFYQLSDLSNNVVTMKTSLEIYDHLPPIITIKKDLTLSFGIPFIWSNFLTITDNYDTIIDIRIYDMNVDYTKLGDYPISIRATDQSGLSSEIYQTLSIIDTEKPRIIMKSQTPVIPVFSNESETLLKSFILSVTDNYDMLDIKDVIVNHDIEWDVLGEYTIYYALSDHSKNTLETTIRVKIKDLVKPVIWFSQPLIFEVFDEMPFINQYIEYQDNYDSKNNLSIKTTTSFKMNVIGKYPITVEVTDKSGNKEILQSYVQIVDSIPPIITQLNDIIVTDFIKKDYKLYFSLADNYDRSDQIKIFIDDQLVNYHEIGSYPISVYATDQSENQRILNSEVLVIDIMDPILELKKYSILLQIDSQPIDLFSLVKDLSDNYDNLEVSDLVLEGEVQYNKVGVYHIIYYLKDSSLNTTKRVLQVIVDDRIPPIISSTSLSLYTNQIFNPLEGIYVEDNMGDYELFIFPRSLDTSIPGQKKITYVAVDQRGNYTTYIREITIIEAEKNHELTSYLPIVVITILGIASIYYLYKKG